ncbi:MAG: rod shape-determining protein MreC [Chloroflexota bacterium]|nr:rod shape-determining protein MreC [Chloroflexota bacterium]
MSTLNTRQTLALVVLFVATSLAFIQLDNRRALDPVKDGVYGLLAPALDALDAVGGGTDGGSPLERELAVLKTENAQLLAENARLKGEVRETNDLRLAAGLPKELPNWRFLQARVTLRDPAGFQKLFQINRGRADGVAVGMAVVAQGTNYVGQVTEVQERTAKVMLIVDASQTVGARLDDGAEGVVYGMWQNQGRLELRHLERTAEPNPGETVLTTDNSLISTSGVPGGLILGRVGDEVEQNRQSDLQTVPVIPLIDFDKLQVVTVLLTNEG